MPQRGEEDRADRAGPAFLPDSAESRNDKNPEQGQLSELDKRLIKWGRWDIGFRLVFNPCLMVLGIILAISGHPFWGLALFVGALIGLLYYVYLLNMDRRR